MVHGVVYLAAIVADEGRLLLRRHSILRQVFRDFHDLSFALLLRALKLHLQLLNLKPVPLIIFFQSF